MTFWQELLLGGRVSPNSIFPSIYLSHLFSCQIHHKPDKHELAILIAGISAESVSTRKSEVTQNPEDKLLKGRVHSPNNSVRCASSLRCPIYYTRVIDHGMTRSVMDLIGNQLICRSLMLEHVA